MIPSIVLAAYFCNPLPAAHAVEARSESNPAKTSQEQAGPEALTVERFIQWMLNTGRDRIDFDNRSAKPLNLPSGGVKNKFRGAEDQRQKRNFTDRYAHLVLKKSRSGKEIEPECLILLKTREYYKARKAKHWSFRFSLDGSLERAFSSLGKRDEQGKPIRGAAVNTVQDPDDPEIQERAQAELDFWLKRAARLIAKKKAESRKQTSSPVPAEKPVSRKP